MPSEPTPEPLRAVASTAEPTPADAEPEPELDLIELDDEIDAMQTIVIFLDALPPTAQRRILVYLTDRYLLDSDPDLPPLTPPSRNTRNN